MSGICAHCGEPITSLAVLPVEGIGPDGRTLESVTFSCPRCGRVISAGFDLYAAVVFLAAKIEGAAEKITDDVVSEVIAVPEAVAEHAARAK